MKNACRYETLDGEEPGPERGDGSWSILISYAVVSSGAFDPDCTEISIYHSSG